MKVSSRSRAAVRVEKSRCAMSSAAGVEGRQARISEMRAFLHADGALVREFDSSATEWATTLDANNYGEIRFTYTNKTAKTQTAAKLIAFVDLDVDRDLNGYANEYGVFTSLSLPPGTPASAIAATSWEIDEPGFLFGNIYQHLVAGALDNTNSVPASTPDDVSMALGFPLGDIKAGATVTLVLRTSRIDIGGLRQVDPDSNVSTWLNGYATFGAAGTQDPHLPETPAPPSLILVITGLAGGAAYRWRKWRRGATLLMVVLLVAVGGSSGMLHSTCSAQDTNVGSSRSQPMKAFAIAEQAE
ncbi:hypothetical protein [Paludibaculum fermentans]|uniref:hypothetical protein n=1 Tax=Paludibaculum fermentans TaxID=1473598 RepID=UPI003EC0FBB9